MLASTNRADVLDKVHNTKLSLTSTSAKLGHSHSKHSMCMFMTIYFSSYVVIRAGSFSWHAVEMHSLRENYDLYAFYPLEVPNYANLIQALLRPGRFDRHIMIDLPNVFERREILEQVCAIFVLRCIPFQPC